MRHVAVLGTGIMGAGMARSLLRSGLDVTVWNRSPDRAARLAADGAQVAGTAAEAVAGVDGVVTMLWDGGSVAEVMAEALPAAPDRVLWAQTSTVSLDDAGVRLPALAGRYGARYVDAPVLGSRQPAEEGKLVVLAASPGPLRDPVTPLFEAIAARTVWVSERPGDGTRLKLVANSWVGTIVAATAQAIALARSLGLDPQVFLDTVRGGAVDTPFVHL
jgi:3-hydroxyisobutyrate dehydrogenase